MATKTKKSSVATATKATKSTDAKRSAKVSNQPTHEQTIDVEQFRVVHNGKSLRPGQAKEGVLHYIKRGVLSFIEKAQSVVHGELQWVKFGGTEHGRVSANKYNVKVEFYIPHGDYRDERALADMLEIESEQLADQICEYDVPALIEYIKLKEVKQP